MPGQQPGYRVHRRGQQPLAAVHEVDRGGLAAGEVRQHGQPVRLRPLLGRQQHQGGTVGQRRGVAGGHRVAEDRRQRRELVQRGVLAQVLVAGQPEVGGHQVVEEPAPVPVGQPPVRGQCQLVLLGPADAPLLRGQRRVLAHGQAGTRFRVARDLRPERLARPQPGSRPEPVPRGTRPVQREQRGPVVLVDRQRRVARGVHPAGDADVELTERDLVRDQDHRFQPGAAGLRDVIGRRRRVEARSQHAFTSEVIVAAVLEHRARDDFADALPGKTEPGDQTVERGGQQVLVRRQGVGAGGPGERGTVAPQYRRSSNSRRHPRLPTQNRCTQPTYQ